ncbi:MAG: anaerobic sulfatase maturase [Gemmatimonadales bacterium]|nr:MAG: anaerobic sulfatase maturase [Gemmatimonadales bacterium]
MTATNHRPAAPPAPTAFQVFAKPGGPICNLDCRYCYYLAKESLFPGVRGARMDVALLEEYIVQQIEASPGEAIRFSWHGGEPTILGLDYFRTIVALQRRHCPPGRRIHNGIVTNGILVDEEWCRFLAAEGFAVSLSLDGPSELHDRHRVTKGREPTHRRVVRAFHLLRQHGVPTDVLCVVHADNVSHPGPVYRFFKEIGATYLGFLPLVQRREDLPAGVGEETVPADALGSFLCTIFDEWVRNDIGTIMIQTFDEAARSIRGLEHSLCVFRETCGDIPVLEHNGDLFSCDHFVDRQHLLGNIRTTRLGEMLRDPRHSRFGDEKRDLLPGYCRRCEVLAMCNGGCPKDRFSRTPDGETGLNYLCAAYKRFFSHSRPMFARLVPPWKAGAGAAELMAVARGARPRVLSGTARNQPCPCGSGRKFKHCCRGSHAHPFEKVRE